MTTETKSVAELAAETKALFERRTDEVKSIAEKALAEAANGIDMTKTAKELADQAIAGMNEAKSRLDDLEQKQARPQGDAEKPASYGAQLLGSDQFKSFIERGSQGSMKLEMKAMQFRYRMIMLEETTKKARRRRSSWTKLAREWSCG